MVMFKKSEIYDILYLNLDFTFWSDAKQWGYTVGFGLEEGFLSQNFKFFTLTKHWLGRIQEVVKGKLFRQVWCEVVRNEIDDTLGNWLESNINIRVAIIFESLNYSSEEIDLNPGLLTRRKIVLDRLKYFTHCIVVDEYDCEYLNSNNIIKAFWWPVAIPSRFVMTSIDNRPENKAIFLGSIYGSRVNYINCIPKDRLILNKSTSLFLPLLFNINQIIAYYISKYYPFNVEKFMILNIRILRFLRRKEFEAYLKSISNYNILINLPSFVKAFPGRVIEGMSVGCTVLSNRINDRPWANSNFVDNESIFYYNNEVDFLEIFRKLYTNDTSSVKNKAINNVIKFHTIEKRFSDFYLWLK